MVSMHQVPTCLMCAACWAAMPSMADLKYANSNKGIQIMHYTIKLFHLKSLSQKDALGLHEQGVFFCQLFFHVLQLNLELNVLCERNHTSQRSVDRLEHTAENFKDIQGINHFFSLIFLIPILGIYFTLFSEVVSIATHSESEICICTSRQPSLSSPHCFRRASSRW